MTEIRINCYEALVLFPQSAASDLQGCADHIREIVDRAEGELLGLRKWDERRLAYDIAGNKRGIYFLAYFKARANAMSGIERDLNLSERVLRSLVVRAENMTEEQMRSADGREQLADEARLRAAEPATATVPAESGEVASEA
ncbi:MAG TPA: 30S ribosomal protein S6 [Phycisphaerales bacterium]|nr:30S ribosomal protein S6 [Phycisphaerales bacterium]HMP37635.1 30S ribosomal protein S6 [Phycisphaerales bacterium]